MRTLRTLTAALRAGRASVAEVLEETLASPIAWLGPHLASQVWFVMRKGSAPGKAPIISRIDSGSFQ